MNKYKHMTNCPNCSSNIITYDIKTKNLKCNHCNHIFEPRKIEKKIKEINTLNSLIINEQTKLVAKLNRELHGIKCTNCGAVKYIKDKEKYTHCILCGNKTHELVNDENEKTKYILPFTISKEEAFAKHKNDLDKRKLYSNEKFLSKFKEENLIGVYIPYRIEDSHYTCSMYGDGYKVNRIKHDSEKDVCIVDKYRINRNVEIAAKDIYYERVDDKIISREDMLENIISEVSPYDVKEKIELKKEYLEEFIIVNPNENPTSDETKKEKLSNIAKYTVLDDILKYDYGVVWDTIEHQIINEKQSYVYLPVWLYYESETIENETKYYYIAINGRTNEIGMQLPFKKQKAMFFSALYTSPVLLIIYLLFRQYFNVSGASIETLKTNPINLILIIFISAFSYSIITYFKYTITRSKYEGSNIINENDKYIDFQRKIISRDEKKGKQYTYTSKQLIERNDNYYH